MEDNGISIIEYMESQFRHFEEKQVLRDEVQKLRYEKTEERFGQLDKRMDKLVSFLKWVVMAVIAIFAIGVPVYMTIYK